MPEGAKIVKVDYDTGEIINKNNKNTIKEIFKKGQDKTDFNETKAIDGGFGMGQELLFSNELFYRDEPNKSFLRKSFGAINTGDQY